MSTGSEQHNNREYVTKPKSIDYDEAEEVSHNPTNLELIEIGAAFRFSHGKLLAVDNYGHLKFIDRGQGKLTEFDDEDYLWDWVIKPYDSKFKHMLWLSCDGGSVQLDLPNHSLVLRFPDKETLNSLQRDFRPAIMMVEPWSGHLHVYNHNNTSTCNILGEKWLKVCDVNGSLVLIPPSSILLEDPGNYQYIKPVTLTKLFFCTREKHLTFSKRVMKVVDRVQSEVLNRQVSQHSDISVPD